MKLWISVEEKLPCDFYSLILDDAISKSVIVDAINKKDDESWFQAGMYATTNGWKWEDEDSAYWKILYWMPKKDQERQFLSECKERYPDLYKQHFEEGGES